MIVPGNIGQVYDAVKLDTKHSEDQGVLCFVACTEADSVCAAQILLNLLQRENIHFTLIPVECYEEVRDHCQPLREAEELKTIILVNCGATEDVRSLCELPNNIRIVIIDNHRPVWHGHNNGEDSDTLVLVDKDDPLPVDEIPVANHEADLDVADSDSEAEEDDSEAEDDGEGGGDDEDEQGGRKRRRGSGDAGPSGRPAKRSSIGPGREERAALRRERAAQIDAYYSTCNGFGKPSTLLLYSLCKEMQQEDNFHVWCAIVGLTEQFIFQQISKQQYNMWRDALANDILVQQDPQDEVPDDPSNILVMPRHKVAVEAHEDLRLTLLRHWSIEESLRYTGYVAARLQTWRQKGLDNLRSLITYMCIPLKQAATAYKGLPKMFPGQLRSNLPRFAPQHMLAWDSLHLNSFLLRYKHEEVTASDMVFALLGLLTAPKPGSVARSHRDAFNEAQSALHVQRNLHLVERGIEQAKKICQDVVHECGLMITANKVKGGRNADYRFVNVADSNAVANPRFTHPTVLKYMALFLRDATSHRFSSADARRPVVVAGPPDEAGMCCVVAVQAKHISGKGLQNNPFARPFLETVSALNILCMKSAFDNTTFYMRKEDVAGFLSKLQEVVGDYGVKQQMQQEVQAAAAQVAAAAAQVEVGAA
ncbi:hypothetical protein HYH03_000589 [Edaphochlamys debaryana]|uniref:Cell division control protein 45 n=1 Tax=Edaphochlamys debaryana TaxID=47281 RepID=A0A835YFS2_9CHLO|nr:hypothetical protein HYH03_000589 [Edaphochlamys debaryana]|eukprot:KAG2502097.1 hypothetical protein HYH03_000589 [Edaphochlamys debaryana]